MINTGTMHGFEYKLCYPFVQLELFCVFMPLRALAFDLYSINCLNLLNSPTISVFMQDETGVYKNLLQETAHRAGLNLPVYTTVRSGPGHVPVFSCTVELAGMTFTGEPAKTKKQAQKSAAMAAWSALKQSAYDFHSLHDLFYLLLACFFCMNSSNISA